MYEREYEATDLFWLPRPAKFVVRLANLLGAKLQGCDVLDLGAGEGKNAVFLAAHGANVLALDMAQVALTRFHRQPGFEAAQHRIKTIHEDARKADFAPASFDIIVAYGLFHCLRNKAEVQSLISGLKAWTRIGGSFVGATLTDRLPIPEAQAYLHDGVLLPEGFLRTAFEEWDIVAYEDDVITETHPTSGIEHQHSLSRIIARKP